VVDVAYRCKKYVNAEKQFTIHEPPVVLTIHLKRFSPLGRKIGHPLQYDESFSLEPFMSSGQFGPSYSLYGVTCHAGGGPNSGHYYSFVKSREGRWWEMNDELIQMTGKATDKKNAYMLFYIQDKGQGLEAAMRIPPSNNTLSPAAPMKNGLAAGMKKRFQKDGDDDDEDKGVKVSPPFIGPLIPSSVVVKDDIRSPVIDPQALSLKSKINAVAEDNARRTLENLGNYDSDDDLASDKANSAVIENVQDEKMRTKSRGKQKDSDRLTSDDAERLSSPPISSPPTVLTSSLADRSPVSTTSFYASSNKSKKRKFPDSGMENYNTPKKKSNPNEARTVGYHAPGTNPFSQISSRPMTYSKRHRRMGI
jgi:ubiquitin carboxyl-terminal hydrolase 36/42